MGRTAVSLSALLVFLGACDEGTQSDPPSVMGAPPEQAAQTATDVVCEYADRCGQITIACPDCAEGQECSCSAEHYEVSFDTCVDDIAPDLETGFACEELTAEEEATVDTCLAALQTEACVTVEQAEAWANGGGGDDPRTVVPECQLLEDIRYRCFE